MFIYESKLNSDDDNISIKYCILSSYFLSELSIDWLVKNSYKLYNEILSRHMLVIHIIIIDF